MSIKRKIFSEYITQVKEDMPGTCACQNTEKIIRGYDCKYLSVPRLETEPILCLLHKRETTPNCYCCWAEQRSVLKEFRYGDQTIPEYR